MLPPAQKNKVCPSLLAMPRRWTRPQATEYHLGLLKAKLARYRAELLEPTSKSGGAGTGFEVQKSGDAVRIYTRSALTATHAATSAYR